MKYDRRSLKKKDEKNVFINKTIKKHHMCIAYTNVLISTEWKSGKGERMEGKAARFWWWKEEVEYL
jgi:uncharacterized protein (DUF2344 family)